MRKRRWTTAALAALVGLPALFVVSAPAARAATGPYGGNAAGDIVHASAVSLPGLNVADVGIARATSDVLSTGLANPAGKRSYARATNIDAPLLSGAVPLTGLVVESTQSAPPTNANPNVQSLTGPIDISPVAALELATASTQARWGANDTTCIAPGTPISTARSTLAELGLLGLGGPLGDNLVSVVNGQGGAVFADSSVGLTDISGQANKGVKSTVLNQVTGVVLFKGSPNEITLNVSAPPTMSAVASGTAATSTVTYNQPVVQIIQDGTETDVLNASNLNTRISIPPAPAALFVVDITLGVLENKVTTATQASGNTNLLHISILDGPTQQIELADVDIAPMSVKSTVPAGGVECNSGAGVQVDPSTPIILPGKSFEYALTIPNSNACALNNVKVVFDLTGPAGSKITGTAPPANTVTDLSATWNDIGSIPPGQLKTLKVTVTAPANAQLGSTFTGSATVTGTCDGASTGGSGTSGPVPTVGSPSETNCDLTASGVISSHKEVRIGDYFNDLVRLTNLGKGTCNAIKVTLPYPPNTSFVSCTDGCTHNDTTRVVTWTIPSLGSGVSKDLVATFKVENTAKAGDRLGTTVTITSGSQKVTDKTDLPLVTSANVLNAGAQRSRGLLPRTGADAPLVMALALMGAFLGVRGLRRRTA